MKSTEKAVMGSSKALSEAEEHFLRFADEDETKAFWARREEKAVTGAGNLTRVETRFRLDIGTDEMNPFAGVSDGDYFRAGGEIYRLSISTQYGLTLRKHDDVSKTLRGFTNLPDYQSFVYAVNMAAVNGLNSLV